MNNLKQNRAASFIAVTLVYIIAAAVGVITYRALTFDWWLSLLIADVTATVATFIFSLIFGNASVYDPYWSVQPPVILAAFAIGKELTTLGVILLVVVSFWAIRLTANWAYTFGNLTHQDWRYTMLHEKTGVFYPAINFVGIHMVPTLVVYGCILPGVYAIRKGLNANIASVLFLCLSLGAVIMQGIADIQMHRFRKNRTAPFIRVGLWKYSRHPNYLGEIFMWWGVGLSVVCAEPSAWYLAAGAVANTVLFLAVSIPMADKRQSRKEGFAEYKKQTRMLLPIKNERLIVNKNYETEARSRFGNTEAFREHEQKTKNYTKEKWSEANEGLMAIFAEFFACKESGASADSAEAQSLVTKLQTHITENYYTCTDEILAGLGKMYVCDERFRKNIDKCGDGTAEYVSKVIEVKFG